MKHSEVKQTETLSSSHLGKYDLILDVRSPSEYAEDRIPGAISLPALTDEERAEVGTLYKQVSQFEARRVGASYISRNVSRYLSEQLADLNPDAHILIYCWRGGMRSGAVATILSAIGWNVTTVKGGYKAWRKTVTTELDRLPLAHSFVLVDGQTGTAKTDILNALSGLGHQIVDLEGLAKHRGSVFGNLLGVSQPSQKAFETGLFATLRRFDAERPVFLEAESNRIGACRIPDILWSEMTRSPAIEITADVPQRACYLSRTYQELIQRPEHIKNTLLRLRRYHSSETIDHWIELLEAEQILGLIRSLIEEHYDPAYARSRKKRNRKIIKSISITELSPAQILTTAKRIGIALDTRTGLVCP